MKAFSGLASTRILRIYAKVASYASNFNIERPRTSWIKVGTNLFEIDDRNYLIFSNYLCRYPIAKELPTTTADTVITATKETVSILDHNSYTDMMIFINSGTSTQRQVHDIPNQMALSKNRFVTSNQSSRYASE